ncbi:MAG TPA: EAL domain-containing protein [Acidimicrobiales bacterium]|nr:EAL domain-containing protein [Acidimicrobiales bacterium]
MAIAGGVSRHPRAAEPPDYRQLFNGIPKPAWVRSASTDEFLEVNDVAAAHYGYTRDEFLDLPPGRIRARGAQATTEPGRRTERHVKKDGSRILMRIDAAVIRIGDDDALLEIADDITADHAVDLARSETEARFREAEEIAHIGSWTWDIADDIVRWSDELCRIFGLAPGDAPTNLTDFLAHVHPDDRQLTIATVQKAVETLESYDNVYRVVHPSGDIRWIHTRGRIAAGADGRASRVSGIAQDITERKLAEDDLTRRALHDSLTGLPERTLFMDRLEQAIRRLDRSDAALAVLFLDLDRFKAVNDKHGHAAGDQALRMTTQRLARILRPGDTISRFGGDEFAILCEDLTAEAAVEIAGRIVTVLAEPLVIEGRAVTTGASVGVALSYDATTAAESLLHDADAAMYEAKEQGRDRYVLFDNASRVRGLARLRRAEEVRKAVHNGELRLFYQPDIDLRTDDTVGVEALVRWQHPKMGLVGPDEFITIAEETGAVVVLGEWVLEQACDQVMQWAELHQRPPFGVSVNISACQLSEPSLVRAVERALEFSGLPAANLCLEITESVLMDDVQSSVKALLDLKALGIKLAIDDFGTGYSSLNYLRRFPVDVVKIDRAFIAGVGIDPAADAIVAAVTNLSHALGLTVVAEGVETDEQLVAIRALGCDRAQGFYWSPSLPAAELDQWHAPQRAGAAEIEPVDVYGLLTERTGALRETTGRAVLLEAPQKLGSVVAERRALRTVLDHLLGNAVLYSPADRPVVLTGASDRHWVRLSVADFGIGMTTEEAARCFEQFWQADAPDGTQPRGTGMGLYIVRSLVEAMGGHIGVRSAKGKGSTFTVALPRSTAGATKMRPMARATGTRARLGEDSSIREFMRQIGVPTRRGA